MSQLENSTVKAGLVSISLFTARHVTTSLQIFRRRGRSRSQASPSGASRVSSVSYILSDRLSFWQAVVLFSNEAEVIQNRSAEKISECTGSLWSHCRVWRTSMCMEKPWRSFSVILKSWYSSWRRPTPRTSSPTTPWSRWKTVSQVWPPLISTSVQSYSTPWPASQLQLLAPCRSHLAPGT